MVTGAVSRDDGAFEPRAGAPFVGRLGRRVAEYVECGLRENGRPIKVDTIVTEHAAFLLPIENRMFRLAARLNIFPRWMLGRIENPSPPRLTWRVGTGGYGDIARRSLARSGLRRQADARRAVSLGAQPGLRRTWYLLPESHWAAQLSLRRAMSPARKPCR
jgi:hypothetical protein